MTFAAAMFFVYYVCGYIFMSDHRLPPSGDSACSDWSADADGESIIATSSLDWVVVCFLTQ